MAVVPAPAPPGGAWISIKTLALRTPSMERKARSASFLIVAGTFGSFVAIASCTLTSPLSIWIVFTRPNETTSRVKPGYFTVFNAFFISSSEIDIYKAYLRLTGGKPCSSRDNFDAAIGAGNPPCIESGNRFRRKNESVAGRLSPRNLDFAIQTNSHISTSLGSPGDED